MTLTPAAFWFLRHGQTDWNKDNLAQGSVDVPLNAHGREQAHAAAAALVGQGIASIVCSPLVRARVTGEIVAGKLGLPLEIAPDLHEVRFGEMEGKLMLAPWFGQWIIGAHTPAGAENFADLSKRAVRAVNAVLAKHEAPVLVIAHGGFFRGLRAAMGLPPDVRLANAVPQYCTPGRPWDLRAVE
jgi:broad specificity phosphatase PhoE